MIDEEDASGQMLEMPAEVLEHQTGSSIHDESAYLKNTIVNAPVNISGNTKETIYGDKITHIHPEAKQTKLIDFTKVTSNIDYSTVKSSICYQKRYFSGQGSAKLSDLGAKLNRSPIIAITGIAGAGKSYLATFYAYCYQKKFHLVYRFLADTEEHLLNDYETLAVQLGISANTTYLDPQQKKEALKKFVKQALNSAEKTFLLLFDNVDDPNMKDIIGEYFPSIDLTKFPNKKVIITTQNSKFYLEENRTFRIDGFSKAEAANFLKKIEGDTKTLAEAFDYLPLGVAAAKLYIQQNPETSIKDYLELLENDIGIANIEEQEDLYIAEYSPDKQKGYRHQRAALRLALQKVGEAGHILAIGAFLAPDNIPFNLLQSTLSSALNQLPLLVKSILNKHLSILESYSLINRGKSENISMHRITQKVGRTYYGQENYEKGKFLISLIDSMNIKFNYSIYSRLLLIEHHQLIPHVLALIEHTLTKVEVNKSLQELRLKTGIYYIFYSGDKKSAENIFLQILKASETTNLYSKYIAYAYAYLAYLCLEDAQEKRAVEYSKLALMEAHKLSNFKDRCFIQDFSLSIIAHIFRTFKYFKEAKQLYKLGLKLLEHAGLSEEAASGVMGGKISLADIYYQKEKYAKAKMCYTEALNSTKDIPWTEEIYIKLGLAELAIKENDIVKGKEDFEIVIKKQKEVYGTNLHQLVASSYCRLGLALNKVGYYKDAIELFIECYNIREKLLEDRKSVV